MGRLADANAVERVKVSSVPDATMVTSVVIIIAADVAIMVPKPIVAVVRIDPCHNVPVIRIP